MTSRIFAITHTLDDIKLRMKQTHSNPNVGKTDQVVLKNGHRAFRVATVFEILDPAREETHHYSLRVRKYDRRSNGCVAGRAVVSYVAYDLAMNKRRCTMHNMKQRPYRPYKETS